MISTSGNGSRERDFRRPPCFVHTSRRIRRSAEPRWPRISPVHIASRPAKHATNRGGAEFGVATPWAPHPPRAGVAQSAPATAQTAHLVSCGAPPESTSRCPIPAQPPSLHARSSTLARRLARLHGGEPYPACPPDVES